MVRLIKKYALREKVLLLLIFFMPIHQKTSTLLIIISSFLALLCFDLSSLSDKKKWIKFSPLVLLFIIYALAYYKDTFTVHSRMFEQKASLLAFPIIFFSLNITKEKTIQLFKYLVYGCLVSYVFLLLLALSKSIDLNSFQFNFADKEYLGRDYDYLQYNFFLGKTFTNGFHSTYLSIYFLIALLITSVYKNYFPVRLNYLMQICFCCFIFQAFSIYSILLLFIVGLSHQIKIIRSFSLVILFSICIVGIIKHEKVIEHESRIQIWQTSLKVIKGEPLFGYGIKKAQRKLHDSYPKRGEFGALSQKRKLDTHNQYLQLFIETGLLGFLLYLFLIISLIKISFRDDKMNTLLKYFIFIFLSLSMLESIFNTYLGISFFTFFICLFLKLSLVDKKLKTM